ncbi:MAG TPA: hypothetical protein VG346_05620, partial [Acidimicrobiales bacterium]|nr:hypothetical protein [Acidimicrobiales bacterium]
MTRGKPAPLMVAPFRLDSLREPPGERSQPGRGARRRGASSRRRRRRRRRVLVPLLVLAVMVAAGAFVWVRLRAAAPAPVVSSALPAAAPVSAQTVPLPWPATGQGAVAIPAVGVAAASGPEKPVPVASLTKLMTAYVILRDHPLVPGEAGPSVAVTQADVDDFNHDTVSDDSNAQVTVGEELTEQQLLG